MKINYIIGGAKAGKTKFCIDKALEKQSSEENSIIIVPEQSSLQVEGKLIEQSTNNSIMKVQVYSFKRLAHKIFAETGQDNKVYIEDIGKLMLVRMILDKNKNNLQFYNKGYNKNGFIESITDTIGELTQYNVTKENLEKIIDGGKINKSLQLKLMDINLIYEEYNKFIKDKYISTSEILDVLSEKIQHSNYIKSADIFVDGFSGLTSQEYKIISRLSMFAKSITITFEIDGKYKLNNKLDPYYEPKKMKKNITDIIESHGLKVACEKKLVNKTLDNLELDFLKENFFDKYKKFKEEVNNISIIAYKNKYDEIEGVAKNIIGLVKDKGYSFRDVSIVVGNIDSYQSIISGVFFDYNIPIFIDKKSDVMNNSLTKIIRGIIQVFVSNYSYESIFKVLKNELCNISIDEVEKLENYILEYGLTGYRWNMEKWYFGLKNSNYNIEEIEETRKKVNTLFSPFTYELDKKSVYKVKFLMGRLVNFLLENKIFDKLEELKEIAKSKANKKEEKEYSQIWEKYIGLFDKIVDILGEEEVSVKELGGILDSGIKGLSLGLVPTYQNQVLLGDITRSKLPNSKAVFLLGVNEGELPTIVKENNILCDNDKETLAEEGIALSKTAGDYFLSQQLEIYNVLVGCSDKIFITFPKSTIDGGKLKASSLVYKMLNLYEKLQVKEDEFDITIKNKMLDKVVDIILKKHKNNSISETETIILNYFVESGYKNLVEKIKLIIIGKDGNEILSKSTVEKIYGREITTSISKLERYANCPYAYFVEYNLKAQERKLYELGSLDLGNLFHEILDRFSKSMEQKNINWDDLEEDKINSMVEKIVESMESEEGSIYKSSSRYNHYLTRAKEICKKSIFALSEQLKSSDFSIIGSEIDFGIKDKISTIVIDVGDERFLKLTGKVDRIDVMDKDGRRFVKIIDYKSGNKKFDEQDVYDGVQLQLLSYLNAILENGSKILKDKIIYEYLPGGVFYFNIQNPKFEADELEKSDYKKQLLKKFKLSGIVTSDVEVIKGMDKNIPVVDDNLVGGSDIIPIYFNKDGSLSTSRSKALDKDGFKDILEVTKRNIEKIGQDIFGGKIPVKPLINSKNNACSYCKYSSICEVEVLKIIDK